MKMRVKDQRGFVLIAMAAAMFLLLAVVGMAFDLGRIYIARNEAQVFTDAASMAAAVHLDGTAAGLAQARAAVAHLPNRWNLGTRNFQNVVIEFSPDGQKWDPEPKEVAAVRYARVTAPDNQVEIMFLRAVGGPERFTVPARAVASTNPVRLTE
jgi:Flp pilus assembly protein TadG